MRSVKKISLVLGALLVLAGQIQAQYFGRNKASYENFEHEVYRTPNFDIYHYLENQEALINFAQCSEQWYEMH